MNGLAEKFFCRPMAISENLLQPTVDVVQSYLRGDSPTIDVLERPEVLGGKFMKNSGDFRIVDGKGIIPIHGFISKRADIFMYIFGGTSTLLVEEKFTEYLNNEQVSEIILDIDSPGGSSDGVDDLAELIFASRGKKKITAYVNGLMASAAYWIGAAAEKIYATRTSDIGSIGVYSVLYDMTVAAHNAGAKVEVIRAGRNKATGHPLKPMSEEDKQIVKEQVYEVYQFFTEAVAKFRGISGQELSDVATGRTFIAEKAMRMNLIDGIGSIEGEMRQSGSQFKNKSVNQSVSVAQTEITTQEEKTMEGIKIADITADQLKEQNPALHASIFQAGADSEKAARDNAVKQAVDADRARSAAINAKGSLKEYAGCSDIVQDAISSGQTLEAAEGRMKDRRLSALTAAGAAAPGTTEAQEDENLDKLSFEKKAQVMWDKNINDVRRDFESKEKLELYLRREASAADRK